LSVITQTTPPDQRGTYLSHGKTKDRGDQKNVVGWDNFGEMITCKTAKKRGL